MQCIFFFFDFDNITSYWELRYGLKIDLGALHKGRSYLQDILCIFDTLDELKVWCNLHSLDSNKLEIDNRDD